MAKRNFIKGFTVSTVPYNGIYETAVFNQYGQIVKSKISFDEHSADRMHMNICAEVKAN